jgi:hypothetical protein
MFNVDGVIEEARRMALIDDSSGTTTRALGPTAHDAFAIFEDLFLLGNGGRPQFPQLESLHKTFSLDLIETVLQTLPQGESLFPFTHPRPELSASCCPQIIQVHSIPSPYSLTRITTPPHPPAPQTQNASRALHLPLSLHHTCVVFLLLKEISSELETEAKVIFTLLIKPIGGETDAYEPRPAWADGETD